MRSNYISLLLFLNLGLWAQVPEPAPAQVKPILLLGGKAHLGNGKVIENAAIGFERGKLTLVVDAATIKPDPLRYTIINTSGKHIYPGFIMPAIDVGLGEVNSVKATMDNKETGGLNPNVRSIVAYNTDSEVLPTLRFNGVLMVQSSPDGGTISGSSSVVQLDAWNWEDAAYQTDDAIHLHWPERMRRRFNRQTFRMGTGKNENYDRDMAALDELFKEAAAYAKQPKHDRVNLKLAAMAGLFNGKKGLFLYAKKAKPMIESVTFAKKHGVKRIVLVGANDALLIKDFLLQHKIPLVLDSVHAVPTYNWSDVDEAYKRPAQLHEAGIAFCLRHGNRTYGRNLAFYAGTAAAYGLPYEEAVRSITLSTAEILGVGDRVGSLEVGKDATLFVSQGDALDMRTNILEHAFIQGRKISVDGRQQALFKRYKKKYKH